MTLSSHNSVCCLYWRSYFHTKPSALILVSCIRYLIISLENFINFQLSIVDIFIGRCLSSLFIVILSRLNMVMRPLPYTTPSSSRCKYTYTFILFTLLLSNYSDTTTLTFALPSRPPQRPPNASCSLQPTLPPRSLLLVVRYLVHAPLRLPRKSPQTHITIVHNTYRPPKYI